MMHQTSDLKYGENDFVQILEMPYAGNDLSMVIILPREIDGLQNVEEILSVDNLQEWSRNSYEEPVEVFFPRFTTTFQFDLKNVLKEMGMKDAFVTGKANFSGMDGNPDWLYIGFAVHKAFVDVNEEGTEAAAATVGGGCFPSGTEVLTVNGPRAIETVDTGTKVYAYNLATGRWVLKRVLKRSSYQYEGDMITILTGHITIHATGNHPFFVLYGDNLKARPLPQDVSQEEQRAIEYGRWVEARDLKEGDVLKDKNGEGLIITSLSSLPDKTEVYNLDIEDCHNYAVHQQGILVHNKGKKEVLPIMFRVDHPFLFLIRDNLTGSILFMGRVSSPR
jgi:serine protease inhibitor